MKTNRTIQHKIMKLTSEYLKQRAETGRTEDINFMMENLSAEGPFVHQKMIDYALGLVVSEEGRERIRYFLFNGNRIQRNYAALYFKRLGQTWIIDEAVGQGAVDDVQAYSR